MNWTPQQQDVLDVMRAEWRAFYAGDYEGFSRCWLHGPEVRRMLSGPYAGTSVATGWEEISAQVREVLNRRPQDFVADEWLRWDNLRLHVCGDIAWASYDQVTLKPNPGILAAELAHEVKILQKTGEGWKLVSLSGVIPAFGRTDVPQIEISLDGKVSRVNELARDRLLSHPGLVLSGDKVRARNRSFDPGLQGAITRALGTPTLNWPRSRIDEGLAATPLGEDDTGRPLYCWVTSEQWKVLVTFDDSVLVNRTLEMAAEIYALSPAQLELCGLLAEGADLKAASDTLGVSVNTLRTQLSRMFDKTGTHSQTALISALLTVRRPR